jgi:thiol-disulfide isomerase/thioredoxin
MSAPTPSVAPDALLLLGTHCPHCPTVLQGLSELVKAGEIGSLEVVNIEQRPEVAEGLGVRSVPWVRIGRYELTGLRSPAELRQWVQRVGTEEGYTAYLEELLSEGRMPRVLEYVKQDEAWFDALLRLLAEPDTALNVRIAIGAIMEELEGSALLCSRVPALIDLLGHADARVRSDAGHYLGLSRSPQARADLCAQLLRGAPHDRGCPRPRRDALRPPRVVRAFPRV